MEKAQPIIENWFESKKWSPFDWQREVWEAFLDGRSGLLNAPTGSGKTFALFMPALMRWIEAHPNNYQTKENNGLQLLWITPLRHWPETWKRSCRKLWMILALYSASQKQTD
ncbi:MAG: DEAD/DEAH box helicase [Bacteroidetes bacterium]|jgi:ATP-dependent Lhr-like helicase|nr:DEAD/DEAH box helicase [Bacteroidota bacterium]